MAKLSDLFGRKGGDGDTATPMRTSPRNSPQNRGRLDQPFEPSEGETFSEIGSRMGEKNEFLRTLLSDTGRKISELDELKETFQKLVQPFNSTLRALEQEKSENLSLVNRLEEARTAYETLRNEFYIIEKKASALEAETEKQRAALELAREITQGFESKQLELTDEIRNLHARIAELEFQLEQERSQRVNLGEARRGLQEQVEDSEKRILDLESELAGTREKLILIEDDKRSLQHSLDQALNETARLGRRLSESDNSLAATRSQLSTVEANFSEIFSERGRLVTALDELKEQQQSERSNYNVRLEALQSRAATAERLLAEARQNLIARTEEARSFDRRSVEATIARNEAEKRLEQIEALREKRERQIQDLEQERLTFTERNGALAKALKAREAALVRAEEKIVALTERNGHLEAERQISRTNIEKRIEELSATLQRERMERAVVEGALEATRADNMRLQDEATTLRTMLRRGMDADDAMAPGAPANDEGSFASVRREAANASPKA